jgi:hypothetical protein
VRVARGLLLLGWGGHLPVYVFFEGTFMPCCLAASKPNADTLCNQSPRTVASSSARVRTILLGNAPMPKEYSDKILSLSGFLLMLLAS